LHEPVGGHDEIGDLDLHVHEMANKVRYAEQKRDEYVQMVNHDLRAPLAAIQTVLAGILKGLYGDLTDKGRTRVSDARQDARRLLDLINETMETDRLDSPQFQLSREQFNLADLINGVIASLQSLLEQKQINIDYTPAEIGVLADRQLLHRVVLNFLDNAIKYGPERSTIQIVTDQAAKEVTVEVNDEGPGIDSADCDRIFRAYERGSDRTDKEGKGLGLAICRAIVEAHGGRIGVQGRAEKGSSFWFAIPMAGNE
jgi:signal transduction histidine kinase